MTSTVPATVRMRAAVWAALGAIFAALLAVASLTSSASAATSTTVAVPMTATPTSAIAVTAGDTVTIAAAGSASCDNNWDCGSGPDGVTSGTYYMSNGCATFSNNNDCPSAESQIGALVYAISSSGAPTSAGAYSLVGAANTITASASGTLYLMVNDGGLHTGGYNDDFGGYSVTLTKNTSAPAANPRVLVVPAHAGAPVQTGDYVVSGQKVQVRATGSANCGNAATCASGPQGVTAGSYYDASGCGDWATNNGYSSQGCLADGAQIGALVYAIGATTAAHNAFTAVPASGVITAGTAGQLVLMYNDVVGSYVDNAGGYSVAVSTPPAAGSLTVTQAAASSATAVDTGVSVAAGDEVHVTAAGVGTCVNSGAGCLFDAAGVDASRTSFYESGGCAAYPGSTGCPDDQAQIGALVYHVGVPTAADYTNGFERIGASGTFTADRSGDVYLVVNDVTNGYSDNTGAFSVALTTTTSAYAQAVLARGPSAYYRLGDPAGSTVATDSSGDSHDGTYSAGATLGAAGAIDGDSDTALGAGTVMAPAASLPTGSAARSVETWFKTSSTGGTAGERLFGYGSQSSQQMFQVNVKGGSPSSVYLFWYGSDVDWSVPGNLADAAWHHLVVTYGGTTADLVIDGVDQGSQSLPTLSTTSASLLIGDAPWQGDPGQTTSFEGSIDDFAVYPSALTTDQARTDYEIGAPVPANRLYTEPFTTTTVSTPVTLPVPTSGTNDACLTASSDAQATPPGCGGTADADGAGALRLTPATADQVGGVFPTLSVPTSGGLDFRFDSHQYGGDGADGILFALAATDPSAPAAPSSLGPSGGALGYASSTPTSGLSHGYLGIGLDGFGNFANTDVDGSGCSDPGWAFTGTNPVAEQVTVRGPGNGTAGYCLLNSTLTTDNNASQNLRGTTRANSTVPVEVAINPTDGALATASGLTVPARQYVVSFTPAGATTSRQISGPLPSIGNGEIGSSLYPPSWLSASGIPARLTFGWAASTGGSNDIHEITNVVVDKLTNAAQSAYAQAVLTDGPSLYYRLGEAPGESVAYDSSGNGNDGGYSQAAVLGQPGGLRSDPDTAVGGDAAATPLVTEANGGGLPTGNSSRTVEMWVKTTQQTQQILAAWGATTPGEMFEIGYRPPANGSSSGQLHVWTWADDTGFSWNTTLNDGRWHQVVVTFDGTTMTAYVDGQSLGGQTLASKSYGALTTTTDNGFQLGHSPGGGSNASYDEVAVYPTVLTSARVLAHYHAADATGPTDDYSTAVLANSPLAYYRLDEATGATTMIDRSGNANDGSYHGTPAFGAAGALKNSSDTATTFGSAGYAYESSAIPRTAFTLETWVNTTDTGPSSGAWFSGEGLIDGEEGGVVGDYGLTLINGRAAFGLGDPVSGVDHTIYSATDVNDGHWHLVDATWDTGGSMAVYVDGQLSASSTGSTAKRTSTTVLTVGISRHLLPLNGTLDEVAIYDKVLSATQIAAHFSAAGLVTVTTPSAPQHVAASAGDTTSTVTWNLPASDGGAPIDQYTVTAHPHAAGNDTSNDVVTTVSAADAAPAAAGDPDSVDVSGLTNGTLYDVSVVAHNSAGNGPAGTTTVTPVAGVVVTVTGSEVYGSTPTLHASPNREVTLDTSSLTCTATTNGKAIDSTLPAGGYTIDGTSCSGAQVSGGNPAAYAISYVGGSFMVTKAGTVVTLSPVSVWRWFLTRSTTFTVTLKDVSGSPLSHAAVKVTVPGYGLACTATTDAAGAGSCTNNAFGLMQVLLSDLVMRQNATASFDGNGNYAASSATAPIVLM